MHTQEPMESAKAALYLHPWRPLKEGFSRVVATGLLMVVTIITIIAVITIVVTFPVVERGLRVTRASAVWSPSSAVAAPGF
ncbi:unnamed protein product [Rangifer tarandus platyrhynchus]|uniref:Uncharacterized protein n=1 Tax=Rangifer tarandus platyrhynchus TaxID=3082113 RepID=A0AC59YKH8_RANTA